MIYTGECEVSEDARRILVAACIKAASEGGAFVTRAHLSEALDEHGGKADAESRLSLEAFSPVATRPLQQIIELANRDGVISAASLRESFIAAAARS